jgi:hypothetical protein
MGQVSRFIVQHARQLAREVAARALVVYADAIDHDEALRQDLRDVDFPTILVTRSQEVGVLPGFESQTWVSVPATHMTRAGQVKAALLVCLGRGILRKGDRVVCLTGADGSGFIDTLLVLNLGSEPQLFSLPDMVAFGRGVAPEVFERVLTLAAQLAAEGREGRPVGVLFAVGDSDRVLGRSRSLVLNPFQGHPESQRNILDPALGETIKEFSSLDGAFVVRGDGLVLAAGVQLLASVPDLTLPGGLGTRHATAAAITAVTDAVAVCVSQSTGTVSVFSAGQLVADMQRPAEVWPFDDRAALGLARGDAGRRAPDPADRPGRS